MDAAVLCVALSPHFADDHTALVGLEGHGLFRSTDGGANWEAIAFQGQEVHSICVADAASNGSLQWVVGASEGVFLSGHSAESLSEVGSWQAITHESTETLGLATVTGMTLVGGGAMLIGTAQRGLWRAEWQTNRWRLAACSGWVAHVPPLIARASAGEVFALDHMGAIARTADGGVTWADCAFDAQLGADLPTLIASGDAGPTVIVAGVDGLYRWDSAQHVFDWYATVALADDDEITALHVAPDEMIWTGSRAGAIQYWQPANQGWVAISALPAPGLIVALHCATPGTLYAVLIRQVPESRYCAELWQIATQPAGEWAMLLALDHLAQPFAGLAVGTAELGMAAHNTLAIASASQPPRLVELDADTRITAIAALADHWYVASNHGICVISAAKKTKPDWVLRGYPVVALFEQQDTLWAVTLGGDIWSMPRRA